MTRKMRAAVGVVAGLIGLVGAVAYRIRYERDRSIPKRQRRLEEIIREASRDNVRIYAD